MSATLLFLFACAVEVISIIAISVRYARQHDLEKICPAGLTLFGSVMLVALAYAAFANNSDSAARDAEYIQATMWLGLVNLVPLVLFGAVGYVVDRHQHSHQH